MIHLLKVYLGLQWLVSIRLGPVEMGDVYMRFVYDDSCDALDVLD